MACCACLNVRYSPIDFGGVNHERWRCPDCGREFQPVPRVAVADPDDVATREQVEVLGVDVSELRAGQERLLARIADLERRVWYSAR